MTTFTRPACCRGKFLSCHLQECTEATLTPEDECTICQEPYSMLDPKVIIVDCSHIFGRTCITNWLRRTNTCPLCRKVLFPTERGDNQYIFPTAITPVSFLLRFILEMKTRLGALMRRNIVGRTIQALFDFAVGALDAVAVGMRSVMIECIKITVGMFRYVRSVVREKLRGRTPRRWLSCAAMFGVVLTVLYQTRGIVAL